MSQLSVLLHNLWIFLKKISTTKNFDNQRSKQDTNNFQKNLKH
jgi:hypothetical protein